MRLTEEVRGDYLQAAKAEVFTENIEEIKQSLSEAKDEMRVVNINCNGPAADTFGLVEAKISSFHFNVVPVDGKCPVALLTCYSVEDSSLPKHPVTKDINEYQHDEWFWGDMQQYCMISFIESGFLVPGKEEFAASYRVEHSVLINFPEQTVHLLWGDGAPALCVQPCILCGQIELPNAPAPEDLPLGEPRS